ncbi:putative beta-lysine N-acetyltransferase [Desulfotomaculum arcticum]|uniref:Putative beta-lysine N-acetyltransferase n=1 Tax=Desulfotruncus arcticus DSM 17038 TaxID=1121424 RepID=A0A1I2ZDU9_9FIRM|nr:putative beta-lysine N-acetyltransferase [Desulfotruncus arcticus]SFH36023.1 putative beta-lysine N-acetyltransferase [Desulfotomaculum arcticum] [Desulfotruncus arcticus DSM 17038]
MFAPVKMNTISENNQYFSIKMTLDSFSKRIWVKSFSCEDPLKMIKYLKNCCREHGLEKIIMPAAQEHLKSFEKGGFRPEGLIEGYFNGRAAYFLTAYTDPRRAKSDKYDQYLDNVHKIVQSPLKNPGPLKPGYRVEVPTTKDVNEMAMVFKKVFATYPSPVDQPDYLAAVLGKSTLFRAVKYNGAIVSIAAAEVDRDNSSAELTNCATLPEMRGMGLMSKLLQELEKDCLANQIDCLYSLARASMYGMNLVFHRLGFVYRGTLINNCHIGGNYEDMNIWVKPAISG